MSTKILIGQAMPGYEDRCNELDHLALSELLGVSIVPGTLNVMFIQEEVLTEPTHTTPQYDFIPCVVGLKDTISKGEEGVPGWIIVFKEEEPTNRFVEIVSDWHVRSKLKQENWPAFGVEIGLQLDT